MEILKGLLSKDKIKELVEGLGYEFVGIEFTAESGRNIMRVYIDSLGGILISDCEEVSKRIDLLLDEHDEKIPKKFFLEVSSPGIERPLFEVKDYVRYKGNRVKVRLRSALQGRKSFKAVIEDVEGDRIFFKVEEEVLCVPISFVSKCNLISDELEKFSSKGKNIKDDRKGRKK